MCEKELAAKLIEKHGEAYRPLIEDALAWLKESEPKWGLKLDAVTFIEAVVSKAHLP